MAQDQLTELEEQTAKEDLAALELTDLLLRHELISMVIRNAQRDQDPRWARLVPQQRRLNEAIAIKQKQERAARGEAEPIAQTVGLNPAMMIGESPSIKQLNDMPEATRPVAAFVGCDGWVQLTCHCGESVIVDLKNQPASATCKCGRSFRIQLALSFKDERKT
jgi:hypothetical protein